MRPGSAAPDYMRRRRITGGPSAQDFSDLADALGPELQRSLREKLNQEFMDVIF